MADKDSMFYNSTTEVRRASITKRNLRKSYTIWCIVLGIIAVVGIGVYVGLDNEFVLVMMPFIAAALTMLTWCIPALFLFADNYETLLAPSFKRTIKTTLFLPIWLMWIVALMAIPVSAKVLASTLADGLGYMFAAMLMTVIPLTALVCGIVSIVFGIQHWRGTSKAESHIYREGPFALALIVFIAEMGLSVWMFSYFML